VSGLGVLPCVRSVLAHVCAPPSCLVLNFKFHRWYVLSVSAHFHSQPSFVLHLTSSVFRWYALSVCVCSLYLAVGIPQL